MTRSGLITGSIQYVTNLKRSVASTLGESNSIGAPDQGIRTCTQATGQSISKFPGQSTMKHVVELLAAYSHTAQAADLQLCHIMALSSPVRAARPSTRRPWSLRERIDEREIAELITAYRNGTTAASLATTHGVSLTSVKRLLRTAGVRRTPSTQGSTKTTLTTYP
jgi:hypothetical protein